MTSLFFFHFILHWGRRQCDEKSAIVLIGSPFFFNSNEQSIDGNLLFLVGQKWVF